MPKKAKIKKVPKIKEGCDATTKCVYDIPNEIVRDSKIKSKDVFEGLNKKKDSAMKKKSSTKKKTPKDKKY
tara:strand:+ start:1105 stop:1317 length:213 start_codon:yes stop_codon:yes gene_type:complete